MTYDDYPMVSDWQRHQMDVGYRTNADVVGAPDISGRCDVWFGMSRCALDASHDGSCKPMSNIP